MTEPKDLIGIVKELRDWRSRLQAHGRTDSFAEADFRKELDDNFPAIAQALLIAVEALEDLQKDNEPSEEMRPETAGEWSAWNHGDVAGRRMRAKEALSRIRSL